MSPNLRVPGHTLVGAGESHRLTSDGELISLGTASGDGRAACSCGAFSPVLPSYGKRYKWMREVHKPEVLEKSVVLGQV